MAAQAVDSQRQWMGVWLWGKGPSEGRSPATSTLAPGSQLPTDAWPLAWSGGPGCDPSPELLGVGGGPKGHRLSRQEPRCAARATSAPVPFPVLSPAPRRGNLSIRGKGRKEK